MMRANKTDLATTASNRTPAEHRAATAKWRETAPKNDSDIMPRAGRSAGRHGSLAEQLAHVKAWMGRPVGVAEEAAQEAAPPISTNWRITPDELNRPPLDGFGVERALEITPSLGEIIRSLEHVEVVEQSRNGRQEYVAIGGDIGRATEGGPIIRVGRLRFSDGTQSERCQILVEDGKVTEGEHLMPVGAMLGTREKSTRDKGASRDASETTASNNYFAEALGARLSRPIRMIPRKQGKRQSKADDAATLAAAYANTPKLPPIKKLPAGLPALPGNVADIFLGMKRGKSPDNGASEWSAIAGALEDRDEWAATLAALGDEHYETLTAAAYVATLRELGEARGYSGKHAVPAGRRLLVAANDNIANAMKLAREAVGNS